MNEQARISASAPDAAIGFTARDFLRMMELDAFEDMRAELVAGVIEKMMPAYMSHGECNGQVAIKLAEAYRGTSYRLGIDLAISIDGATVRAADIAIVVPNLPGDRAASGGDIILVVEIADTTLTRDLGLKARDYARAGIPVYWVVDLKARAVHVMQEPDGSDYAVRRVALFGDPLVAPETSEPIIID